MSAVRGWCPGPRGGRVNAFDVAAILVAAAAVFGYVNHRFLRLPSTSGTLLVALVSSLVVVLIDRVVPGFDLRSAMEGFLGEIDFDQTLISPCTVFQRCCSWSPWSDIFRSRTP